MYSSALSSSNVTTNRANCTGGAAASDSVLTVTPTSHSGSAFTATFTFDQRVALFDINDITVSGGPKVLSLLKVVEKYILLLLLHQVTIL